MKSVSKETENEFKYIDLDDNLNLSTTTPGKQEAKSKNSTIKEIKTYRSLTETNLLRDPKLLRRKANNDYEPPASDRESWWRCTIKVIYLIRLF